MTEHESIIDVNNLRYSYKNSKALLGSTFIVRRGELHGFVGPNGAGKTTILKLLSTLLPPQIGDLRVFGLDVKTNAKAIRRRMGFMPDHFSMYQQMTVFEYLDFFAAAYGLGASERDSTIKDVLTLTDMDGRQNDLIQGLSRGMQQRVSLARVLVHDPELLLLDEPASGLDPRARIELMDILKELKNMGKTVFISSHILAELADLCDSVTIIDQGQIKYTGDIDGLLQTQSTTTEKNYALKLSEANDSLFERLQNMEGMLQVSRGDKEGEYKFTFDSNQISINQIVGTISQQNTAILSIREDVKHLNQAFMELTTAGVRQ